MPSAKTVGVGAEPPTLIELLRRRAQRQPHQLGYTFLTDGESQEATLTYAELDRRARAVGAWLQAAGAAGERVLLLYPPGLEFVAAFFGCLYAGAVAVPAYPPRRNRTPLRLQAIVASAKAALALTTTPILTRVAPLFSQSPYLEGLRWQVTDDIADGLEDDWREPAAGRDHLAYLQYTSGSTGMPKGVMLTHGNLLSNAALVYRACEHTPADSYVSWLPIFHDMGFMAGILQPLYGGFPVVSLSPAAFLQRPLRWLEAISRYRATTSGGPNFAYDLCVRKIGEGERAALDLSSWSVAFNGAEPIRPATLERFAAAFAPCGFRREAFYPCYGLAEATLMVSGGRKAAPPVVASVEAAALERGRAAQARPGDGAARRLVGCGRTMHGQEIVVVNQETLAACAPGEVGEIWVAGPSVAQGYWDRPDETEQTFQARLAPAGEGPFLRTGDLGFLDGGELFVTGRLKDLIIIRGQNHYPQDIEFTSERSHPACRAGCAAAFTVESDGEAQLVVVQEIDDHRRQDLGALVETVRRAVAEEHEIPLNAVVLIRPRTIPKTSSGKIQRQACRTAFLGGELEAVAEWRAASPAESEAVGPVAPGTLESAGDVQSWLVALLAARLGEGPERIDVGRSVVSYGLDSLAAIELVYEIETGLGVRLPLANVLYQSSIAELCSELAALRASADSRGPSRIAPSAETVTEHPLSFGQRALWFLHRLAPDSPAYNLAAAVRVRPPLDAGALRRAFQQLVERHPCLRTTFAERAGQPSQRVHEHAEIFFRQEDASSWDEATLQARLVEEANRPFDLAQGPLLRVSLLGTGAGGQVMLVGVHHIVSDFWSLTVLVAELGRLYDAARAGQTLALAPLSLQYTDYVRWQEEMLSGPEGQRLWDYWRARLAGAPSILSLPTDRPRPPAQTFRGASVTRDFGGGLSRAVKSFSRARGVTPYMTLLAAFQLLLYRHTGQQDLLVGTPSSGRGWAGLSGVVGYFVNPLVLRADLSGGPSFEALVERVRRDALAAFEHQEFPFARLVERLQPERDASRSPLFQVMFVLQQAHLLDEQGLSAFALGEPGARLQLGGLALESLPLEQQVSPFDLTLATAFARGGLKASLQYNSDLFGRPTAERMLDHFRCLLEDALARPARPVAELSLLTDEERHRLLVSWNETGPGPAPELCLHEFFERQAARTPSATALVAGDERLTYEGLNARANRLARHLRASGVGPEARVGVCVGRGAEMVVALVAVLKAGGAYLPLDPAYPKQRLAFMLEDSGARFLLTEERLIDSLPRTTAHTIFLDRDRAEFAPRGADDLAPAARPQNLAYVIYTSGSTGVPKGVAIQHRSAAALLRWAHSAFDADDLGGVLASTSICFDLSVFELFVPLGCGGKVIVAENALELPALKARGEVRLLNTVPSAMAELSRIGAVPASVRVVNLAGEALSRQLVEQVYAQETIRRVWNLYGPSEDTTYSTGAVIEKGRTEKPTIGRPLAGCETYVLDERLRPVPVGVTGELYVGGDGLARGYLNRPELTAERFVPHPFAREGGARLYRTGDLVRYLPDGHIDFLGRRDQQIKLRGFRIEPGEIEAELSRHAALREAVVVARKERDDGDARLVAYVVAGAQPPPAPDDLRSFLRERLPEHMIPSAFVALDALPLTPNGKVDRRALPAPSREARGAVFAAPRTPVEMALASVWSELLKVEPVGAFDNFFELGGHSLLATQLVSRVRDEFKIELPLRRVFERPALCDLAASVGEEIEGQRAAPCAPIRRVERGGPLPLSFAQQRLWFIDQLEPGGPLYNMPAALRLAGRLDADALERALSEIVRRHEVLRTTFEVVGGEPAQIVHPARPHALPVVDLRDQPRADAEAELRRLAREEGRRPFDLRRGPLLRTALVRLGEDDHALLVTMHHIVSDGWSLGVMVEELKALYEAFVEGRPSPLPELEIQYADFAAWQRDRLAGAALEEQLAYWRRQLEGAPTVLKLPTDRPRPALQRHRGGRVAVALPGELAEALRALSRERGATLFMTLLAAWKALLSRHSGQDDLLVGTPIAGRNHAQTEPLVGFFVNTLVMRGDLSGDPTFAGLLARVREAALAAYAHQEVPFEKLVEELQPERDMSRAPLFQVMFVMQNAPARALELPGLKLSRLEDAGEAAKFDLMLELEESGAGVTGFLGYDADLFDARTVGRMATRFRVLLEGVAANPERRLSALPLLGEEERRLLSGWNETRADYERDACLHQLFEAQAAATPSRVAVAFGDQSLTYAELNARANRLARRLQALGVGPEVVVGICLARSVEMLVALVAVLKAGGAYLPLDPEDPEERLSFALGDAGARVLLCGPSVLPSLAERRPEIARVEVGGEAWAGLSESNPPSGVSADNLAYVIYTSGSTGRPKGVMIRHRSVINLARALGRAVYSRYGGPLRVSLNAPLTFDASVKQLAQLISGHTLDIVPEDVRRDGEALLRHVRERRVHVLDTTPTQLRLLVDAGLLESGDGLPRAVLVGGEEIDAGLWRALAGDAARDFFNVYGPTECTVDATVCRVDASEGPSIGRPLGNVELYVLDRAGRPVPVGVEGELCVGGDGLARGYLNRPELTAERFVPHPFGPEPGARLYRTGDLARYLPDGRVEFRGRIDHQIKVRGHRVELGEIEAALDLHPAVAQAVVVLRDEAPGGAAPRDETSAGARLVAYVVAARAEKTPPVEQLRRHLRALLPGYMVPASFAFLDALPLTPNGKIDRRALPAPELTEREGRPGAGAEMTPIEELVAGVFCEVLKVAEVGPDDDFFELGGHSLLATQAVARVREAAGADVGLRELFEGPRVRDFALRVEAARAGQHREPRTPTPPLVPVARDGDLPLSFAQERLWFLDQLEPGTPYYNIPLAVRLKGRLDAGALRRGLDEILRRHESLRTAFSPSADARPVQIVTDDLASDLRVVDLQSLPPTAREEEALRLAAEEARRPFDLTRAPLLRTTLVRLGGDEHVLLLTLHHAVADGWSVGVLMRELSSLYAAFAEGRPPALPRLSVQYADFAHWQRRWMRGEALEDELAYWKRRLAGAPPALPLPTDYPRPAAHSYEGAHLLFRVPEGLTAALKTLSRRSGATLYMTLLAAFYALLYRYTEQEEIVVGTPVANRRRVEVEGIVGLFVNTLALRADLSGQQTFRELLRQVRGATLEAYAHQDVPFEQVVEAIAPARDLSRTPLFQVMFTLQNAPRESLTLPGLSAEFLQVETGASKFDLTLSLTGAGGGLDGVLEYSTDLFGGETAGRMSGHFGALLAGVAADPDGPLRSLPLLTEDERREIFSQRGAEAAPYERVPVHVLFERQAALTPDATALVYEGEALSYRELNARANRLARRLSKMGVGPEARVGVMFERGAEMVVALVAVLKAGGAYLPLDPSYPAERLAYMIEDSGARVLLSRGSLAQGLTLHGARLVCLDSERQALALESGENVATTASADDLAYVIYTSGSTGRPKGVGCGHAGVVNLLTDFAERSPLGVGDNCSCWTSLSFDVSVYEIFSALTAGATLHVVPEDVRADFDRFAAWLEERRIGSAYLPPQMLPGFAARLSQGAASYELRRLLVGVEPIDERLLAAINRALPRLHVINGYGPTEATVCCTLHSLPPTAGLNRNTPIGRAVRNTETYLLDRHLNPVPFGVPGELYVGGDGLARGYLNRPELTGERFVPHPFAREGGARLYRTGDLVRYLPSGDLEFVGRNDRQLKLRGFRIEPGEIEAALREHEGVREAVVLVREDEHGGERLVAYLVAGREPAPAREELRRHARSRLPDYMVPSAFVLLDALPLTPNGKIDRAALPAPQDARRAHRPEAGAEMTPIEELVAGAYAEVLGVERVGVDDDFFELGGHSLLATQAVARVREAAGADVGLRELFEGPRVRDFALRVEAARGAGGRAALPPIERAPRGGELPLSFAQQRLWFLDRLVPDNAFYNIPSAVRLKGRLSVEGLEHSINRLVERHEVLRTTFPTTERGPVQAIAPALKLALPVSDLRALATAERERETLRLASRIAQQPFDLSRGPLLRAALLRLADEEHVLVLTMHHIVSDGWSAGVFVREMAALYEAYSTGNAVALEDVPVQYADFSVWQRRWLRGEALESQLAYWKGRLGGDVPRLQLPTDRPRPAIHSFRGAKRSIELPAGLTESLKGLGRREGATLFMILLAAYKTLLYRYTGQGDIAVGTWVANRRRAELEQMIGFCANTLVLRTGVSDEDSFEGLVARVREVCLGAYMHQDLPFDQLVDELRPERGPLDNPFFQVGFALQNAPMPALKLPGLTLEPFEVDTGRVMFDLILNVVDAGPGLKVYLHYNTDLFGDGTVERMLAHFRAVLEEAAARPDRRLLQIPLDADAGKALAAAPSAVLSAFEGEQFDFLS
ncbi:MAG TPA: amino acid adenylation domain-containing protein [Pyrinomonadaceae bacterium]